MLQLARIMRKYLVGNVVGVDNFVVGMAVRK